MMARKLLLFAIAITVLIITPVRLVIAEPLSDSEIKALNEYPNWVTDNGGRTCSSGGATSLTGSQNGEKIFNFLISKGLTPVQAAGLMGNLQAESGLNPRRVQSTPTPAGDKDTMTIDNQTGYGLAQWTSSGRQTGLHAAALAAGTIDGDLLTQLNYLWTELNAGYKSSTLDPLKNATDIKQATSIVMINFEAPADQSQQAQNGRAALSLAILNKYGSNTATPAPASTATVTVPVNSCGAPGSNAVTGGFSLPTDRKWYDQHPDWFTKPHHLNSNGTPSPASDIPIPTGTVVYSMTDGKIIKAPNEGGYGKGVTIDAGNGVIINYGHGLDGGSVPGAREGDTVKAGQPIMHSDNTGMSTGPHVHVDIVVNGSKRCPQALFADIVNGRTPNISTLPSDGCSAGGL